MCLCVKQLLLTASLLLFVSLGCPAAQASRQVYLEPGVEIVLADPFAHSLHHHALWQIPLAPNTTQVVRLIAVNTQIPQPFYWMQTRLDEQFLRLEVKVGLEIWEGPHLRWQRILTQHRDLRLMGPELRSVGQPLLPQLTQLPHGALTQVGLTSERQQEIRQALWQQSFHLLQQDYLRHNKHSEREMSR